MKFRPLLQCDNNWAFHPLKVWSPALPILCWKRELIVGFEHFNTSAHEALDIQSRCATPLEAVRACHPHLSLPEIARLWSRVKLLSEWRECLEQLWPTYQLRWNHELEVTLEKLALTPRAFQDWCSQKQVGAQDLSPLRSVSNPETFAPVLLAIGQSVLSKSLGIQVLEWTVELALMGVPVEDLMPKSEVDWASSLKAMRYPKVMAKDQEKHRQVRELPWPNRTQAQWIRQGDRGFLEIKLHIESQQDFHRKVEGLSTIEKRLNGLEVLWKT